VMEGWRKLHNEELYNLYSSSGITRMNKTRRMRCTGHEERNGRLIMCNFGLKPRLRREYRLILKCTLWKWG
jgi:hypothetical protein